MLSLHNCLKVKVMSLHNCWKVKVTSLHKGWKASAVCFPISFFMQWPKSFPEMTRWLSATYQIYFATDHGSSAQRGPTCPEEPPTVDSREHGWAAAWMCPYPHPAKSDRFHLTQMYIKSIVVPEIITLTASMIPLTSWYTCSSSTSSSRESETHIRT